MPSLVGRIEKSTDLSLTQPSPGSTPGAHQGAVDSQRALLVRSHRFRQDPLQQLVAQAPLDQQLERCGVSQGL